MVTSSPSIPVLTVTQHAPILRNSREHCLAASAGSPKSGLGSKPNQAIDMTWEL